jgi:hypothetical protein
MLVKAVQAAGSIGVDCKLNLSAEGFDAIKEFSVTF